MCDYSLYSGTELAFEAPVNRDAGFFRKKSTRSTTAIFRQVHPYYAATHHDALEFALGEVWPVTDLSLGQKATVLQLPANPSEGRTRRAEEETREHAVRADASTLASA